MAHILMLYDSKDKDLARDFKELLDELNVGPILLVAQEVDGGLTLEAKEKKCFDGAIGAIFIITPGSERLGKLYPSPSVSHEMGQAKQKFTAKLESVIYLVDKTCVLPAIDQQVRIIFDRTDMRSIVAAVAQLIRDLKAASLLRTAPIPEKIAAKPQVSLEQFTARISDLMKKVLLDLSNLQNGYVEDAAFNKLLAQNHGLAMQAINLLKRDLQTLNLIIHSVTAQPYYFNGWFISDFGWDIVRLEVEQKRESAQRAAAAIAQLFLGKSKPGSGALGQLGGLLTDAPTPLLKGGLVPPSEK